jgi:uncharacterized NAD-dependent epimerase/dehydratase family protein
MTDMLLPVNFPAPYLVYLGDVEEEDCCKTGFGLAEWAGERCVGQMRSSAQTVSVGLLDLDIEQAVAAGAKSLVIGIASVGGHLAASWHEDLRRAALAGLTIVSGAHQRLHDIPGLREAAEQSAAALVEIRNPAISFPVATGVKRRGKRLLTVGTDCALGKKYTALAIARAMRARGLDATFRATGQTGIMIAGGGVPIDSVVCDFVAGAAEALSPEADDQHWDVIEGQGSLLHPGYAAVTLGLLHGSQPDELVLCHDPRRSHNLDSPQVEIPALREVIDLYLAQGRLTNPRIRCQAISLNTRGMHDAERDAALQQARDDTGLIVFDPMATHVDELLERLPGASTVSC